MLHNHHLERGQCSRGSLPASGNKRSVTLTLDYRLWVVWSIPHLCLVFDEIDFGLAGLCRCLCGNNDLGLLVGLLDQDVH